MVGEGEGNKRMETEMYEGGKEKNGIRDGKKEMYELRTGVTMVVTQH